MLGRDQLLAAPLDFPVLHSGHIIGPIGAKKIFCIKFLHVSYVGIAFWSFCSWTVLQKLPQCLDIEATIALSTRLFESHPLDQLVRRFGVKLPKQFSLARFYFFEDQKKKIMKVHLCLIVHKQPQLPWISVWLVHRCKCAWKLQVLEQAKKRGGLSISLFKYPMLIVQTIATRVKQW
jgi:hypothetical protein